MANILVVDDSKFSRGRLVGTLRSEGFFVAEVDNGSAALKHMDGMCPDLVVTDLLMPELDGFGLLRELHKQKCSIPVIVVSADIQASSQAACREFGARAFLNKPFKPEELVTVVREILAAATQECAPC